MIQSKVNWRILIRTILVVGILLCWRGGHIRAQDTALVSIHPATCYANWEDDIEISVVVDEVQDLFAAALDLRYDPSKLSLQHIHEGDFLNSSGTINTVLNYTVDSTFGVIVVGISRTDNSVPGASAACDTPLVGFSFRVLDVGVNDSTRLVLVNVGLIAPDGQTSYPVIVANGKAYFNSTDVEEDEYLASRSQFELRQNYPNPFNNTTTIEYFMPRDGNVSLSIFNIHGEKVAGLVEGFQDRGWKTLNWDGRNADGIEVSSGLYFCLLRGQERTCATKIVLVK